MGRLAFVMLTSLAMVAADLGYDEAGYPDTRWHFSSPGVPPPLPTSSDCGTPWKPLLAGVLIGAIIKIPLLILGKLLLLKLFVPLAVAGAIFPLGVFSIYRVIQQAGGGSTNTTTARLLPQACLEAAACGIGAVAPKTAIPSTSWLLKAMEDALQSSTYVAAYRDAYMRGVETKECPEYPCPFL